MISHYEAATTSFNHWKLAIVFVDSYDLRRNIKTVRKALMITGLLI